MTNDQYTILVNELQDDPLGRGYAGMSDADAAADLNTAYRSEPYQRFASWRAAAAILTDEEYAAAKADTQTLAAMSSRLADMVALLGSPCDDTGATGGIDFGHPEVRAMIDAMPTLSAEGKAKLKAIGERPISRAAELGLPQVYPGHIQSARTMMGG